MASVTKKANFDTFIEEKFIPLGKKIKLGILIAAFAIPLLLFYFLFFQPLLTEGEKLQKDETTATEELKKARQIARDLPTFKKQFEEAQNEFDAMAVLLPKSQEIPNLLRNISDLGKSTGLDFLSFVPGAEIPKDFFAEIPIDISIKGPYHNLGSFLDKVSKLERIVTVNNIQIEKPKEDSKGAKKDTPQPEPNEILINSSCRLVTYRFTNTKIEPVKAQEDKKKSPPPKNNTAPTKPKK